MSGENNIIQSRLFSWAKPLLFADGGFLANTRYFDALPRHHEQYAERLIAIVQFVLALLLIGMMGIDFFGSESSRQGQYVLALLGILATSSAARRLAATQDELPDSALDALTVVDVIAFLSMAIMIQAMSVSSGTSISAGWVAFWLGFLIAIRLVRVHPRPIIVAGCTAFIGLTLAPEIISADPKLDVNADALRFDGATYLGFGLFVAVLIYAAWQARRTMGYMNATLDNMPHGVALFDNENRLVISNSQYSLLYGLTDEHRKRGTSISDLIRYRHEAGCFGEVEYQTHANDWMGSFEASEPSVQRLCDGRTFSILRQRESEGRTVTTTEDVTAQRRLEARVEYLAYHDSLTGLANRAQLRQRLDKAMLQNRNNDGLTAFCMDLDQFKEINDTLGHDVGDDLLKLVGQRLKKCVREEDLVARTGGDEFVVLQIGDCSVENSADLAQRIIDDLVKPYQVRGYQMQIGVSIGIALLDKQNENATSLIKNADIALYRAKESGRGIYCFYEESMGRRLQERRKVESDLRKALDNGEFELHYQPILNAEAGQIESMEALIRWRHPDDGMIPPGNFIPIVDEIGLAVSLGEWVIWQACKDAAALSADIKVSVNVSAAQFHKPGLADAVVDALNSSGLPAERLEIEITETVLLENTETTIVTLNELHELGVRIALDDFGTGYSSLSYLQKFSFDRLKIDRSFVKDALTDHSSSKIIKSVIGLGQSLGMEITAEGVETDEQLHRVTCDGCTAIQGFLISRPLPLPELNSFLLARTKYPADATRKERIMCKVG